MKFLRSLNNIKIINDIFNFLRYKKNENKYHSVFFSENKYTFSYIEENLISHNKKKKIALISFEFFELDLNIDIYYFKTNFFRQIFFLTTKIKYLYCTTPDLNSSLFVKSVYKKTKYIYIQHSPVGLLYKYRHNAFDYFDAVQVVNTFQHNDLKKIINQRTLKIKIIKSKYSFLQILNKKTKENNSNIQILIAPTWNTDFYKKKIHEIIIKNLQDFNAKLYFRPHPMSLKKNEVNLKYLQKLGYIIDSNEVLNISNFSHLITDWSGIFIEFAIIKKKKPILFNTTINSSDRIKQITDNDFEFFSRNLVGNVMNLKDVGNLRNFIINSNDFKDQKDIEDYFDKYFYN